LDRGQSKQITACPLAIAVLAVLVTDTEPTIVATTPLRDMQEAQGL
jgi:hypothetical protein